MEVVLLHLPCRSWPIKASERCERVREPCMVSASQLSALFFIMENDVYILEPCFLARFFGSIAAKFLLLPNYLPVIPFICFI